MLAVPELKLGPAIVAIVCRGPVQSIRLCTGPDVDHTTGASQNRNFNPSWLMRPGRAEFKTPNVALETLRVRRR